MNRIKSFLKRIRLVYRRSSTLTKAVVLSALVLTVAALVVVRLSIDAAQARTQELADEAARYEHENGELQENIDGLGSADSVEQIAKDELGLVDPDTVIIEDKEEQD